MNNGWNVINGTNFKALFFNFLVIEQEKDCFVSQIIYILQDFIFDKLSLNDCPSYSKVAKQNDDKNKPWQNWHKNQY